MPPRGRTLISRGAGAHYLPLKLLVGSWGEGDTSNCVNINTGININTITILLLVLVLLIILMRVLMVIQMLLLRHLIVSLILF